MDEEFEAVFKNYTDNEIIDQEKAFELSFHYVKEKRQRVNFANTMQCFLEETEIDKIFVLGIAAYALACKGVAEFDKIEEGLGNKVKKEVLETMRKRIA